MLDAWLDEYETLWHGCTSPPSLLDFISRVPDAARSNAVRELALIDLEQRWRLYFPSGAAHCDESIRGLGALPTWAEYCRVLPECELNWQEGVCHEFRVRQTFGDRPYYRQVLAPYTELVSELASQLPDIAATVTRASITILADGREHFCGRMPGRLEIGRCRFDEPAAPALVKGHDSSRLLIADLPATNISRAQCRLEVVAKDRLFVQHVSPKGSVWCSPGRRLTKTDSCDVDLPCLLDFHGRKVRIERTAG